MQSPVPREELLQSVERAITGRSGTRQRTADNGEQWLDCRCPLHDDRHRSASYSRDRGTFFCRVCDPNRAIPLERVAQALSLALTPNGEIPGLTMQQPKIETARWAYEYVYPNGELSHWHWRVEYLYHSKTFSFQAPDGTWRRPDPYWPIYGDLGTELRSVVILTEGEKAADSVNMRDLAYEGHPVRAITAGSVQDLISAVEILAVRLKEIDPHLLVLWPDNDEPGKKAMSQLHKALRERHLSPVLLDPNVLKLEAKQDVADFLVAGGDLLLFLQGITRPQVAVKPKDVANQLIVLHSGGILWPDTQFVTRMDQSNCNSLWQKLTGVMPTDRQAKELLNLLRDKLATNAYRDHYRIYCDGKSTIWRSDPGHDCYRLSADGIDREREFPEALVLAAAEASVPIDVNVDSDEGPYLEMCNFFGIGELERVLILGWMVCVLAGLQAPILLLRGEANTGKSVFARLILGIVEPALTTYKATSKRADDERQLIRTLQRSPAILIDNVSAMSADFEDTLSQIVTGYSMSLRRLYTDDVEAVSMKRGVIITTTNWDVYKGDLATRTIVCQPVAEGSLRLADQVVEDRFHALYPAIRGWVFKQVCRYYAEAPHHRDDSTPWRVATLGWVLLALGYDAERLYKLEAKVKSMMLNQNDPWMEAVVAIWETENNGGEFILSITQIQTKMQEYGVPWEQLPKISGPGFARWVEEKRMFMRDHDFYMEKHRDAMTRGYWFRRVK